MISDKHGLAEENLPWKVTDTDAPAVPVQLSVDPLSSLVTWIGACAPPVPTSANVPLYVGPGALSSSSTCCGVLNRSVWHQGTTV
jgi:hypothetical protein